MAVSFNVDIVRRAFEDQEREKRQKARAAQPSSLSMEIEAYPWRYVKEQWTDFLIVQNEGKKNDLVKVPYTVDEKQNVSFGAEEAIKVEYVPLSADGSELLWENPVSPAIALLQEKVRHG